jgi:hypothetical protein
MCMMDRRICRRRYRMAWTSRFRISVLERECIGISIGIGVAEALGGSDDSTMCGMCVWV